MHDSLTDAECTFCSQYATRSRQNFWATGWGYKYNQSTDVLWETESLVVAAGLGALAEGYVLIIPKLHYLSVREMPSTLISEVTDLKVRLRARIEALYGPMVFVEHGTASEERRGGSCIDHVHVHAFPCSTELGSLLRVSFPEIRLHSLHDLKTVSNGESAYILLEDQRGGMFYYDTGNQAHSQFVRRLWAKSVGKAGEWDWAVFIGERNMANTIQHLHLD